MKSFLLLFVLGSNQNLTGLLMRRAQGDARMINYRRIPKKPANPFVTLQYSSGGIESKIDFPMCIISHMKEDKN